MNSLAYYQEPCDEAVRPETTEESAKRRKKIENFHVAEAVRNPHTAGSILKSNTTHGLQIKAERP